VFAAGAPRRLAGSWRSTRGLVRYDPPGHTRGRRPPGPGREKGAKTTEWRKEGKHRKGGKTHTEVNKLVCCKRTATGPVDYLQRSPGVIGKVASPL